MAAFRTVITHLDQQLKGTVIRIPLRTQVHASRSEISERWTTVSEMMEVLQSFASEFGDSGLLFMKNIEKLEIESDDISIRIETTDSKMLRQ
jgi:sacsin